MIATFAYLGALLTDTTGLSGSAVPILLMVYGMGAMTGIVIGGRTADRWPVGTPISGLGGLLVASVLLAGAASHPIPVAVLLVLLGAAGFVINPVLTTRVFALAPHAPTLAPALNVSSFNVGISLGPWLAGLVLTGSDGYAATPLVGAALTASALVLLTAGTRRDRYQRREHQIDPPKIGASRVHRNSLIRRSGSR